MESWKKPHAFVPLNNSDKERRRKEIFERAQREAEYIQCKRKLQETMLENAVLKKAKKDMESHKEIDKVERDRAEWNLTLGGRIGEWSKDVIRLQDRLRTLDKEEEQIASIKKDFDAKIIPKNLPKILKGLEHVTTVHYPEVLSKQEIAKYEKRDWKYRLKVLAAASDNLLNKRKILDANVTVILGQVEKELGKKSTEDFKKKCVDFAIRRWKPGGRKDTPDCFEIFP